MSEARTPKAETGGGGLFVLSGRYDPIQRPIDETRFRDIQTNVDVAAATFHYSDTITERIKLVETLVYLVGLCHEQPPADGLELTALYKKLSRGAMLLDGYGLSGLQSAVNQEAQRLELDRLPAEDAIDDLAARDLVNGYQAGRLSLILKTAAVDESGGNLPGTRTIN